MATLAATPIEFYDAFDFQLGEEFAVYDKRSSAFLDKLEAESNGLPDGEVVGALLRFPRADGYAMYRVTSANPLKLQHIPYGDAWRADAATIRGLRLADVQEMVRRNKAFADIFNAA